MNKLTLILFVVLITFSCQVQRKHKFSWNIEKEKIHNENRNDSTKRSMKCWETDLNYVSLKGEPMIEGVFPVPNYDLADSTFVGIGNSGSWKGIQIGDKTVISHSLYIKKCDVNREHIPEKEDEVYFTIVCLTDTVDLVKYRHTNVSNISRNHPHYTGQGYVKTKTNKVDFIAFLTADRNAYAIVNMRLFDLRIGRLVLIAPQKDGSLRSMQLDSGIRASKEMKNYIADLLQHNTQVIDFFNRTGNI